MFHQMRTLDRLCGCPCVSSSYTGFESLYCAPICTQRKTTKDWTTPHFPSWTWTWLVVANDFPTCARTGTTDRTRHMETTKQLHSQATCAQRSGGCREPVAKSWKCNSRRRSTQWTPSKPPIRERNEEVLAVVNGEPLELFIVRWEEEGFFRQLLST